jgi:hypothetical protein
MENIDLKIIYSILIDGIRNYPLKIILYTTIFLFIGIVFSISKVLVFKRFKVISRQQKYYNVLVKLYIPAVFIINIIFSLKVGLFWGAYEALKKDSYPISEQVYNTSSYYIFKDNTSKAVFITDLKSIVSDLSKNNNNVKVGIVDIAKAYDTKYKAVDQPKNWLAQLFADQYGERIHTLVLYGILNAVPHTDSTSSISYTEFDRLADQFTKLDPENLEYSIVQKIQNLFLYILKSQFKIIIKGILFLWAILMLMPWVEFWIYSYLMKRKRTKINK